ncbi:hypothetical protein OK016_04365 [Vibrio chagasii]|nr:hypothetical protein [Vibrio chagasii]
MLSLTHAFSDEDLDAFNKRMSDRAPTTITLRLAGEPPNSMAFVVSFRFTYRH